MNTKIIFSKWGYPNMIISPNAGVGNCYWSLYSLCRHNVVIHKDMNKWSKSGACCWSIHGVAMDQLTGRALPPKAQKEKHLLHLGWKYSYLHVRELLLITSLPLWIEKNTFFWLVLLPPPWKVHAGLWRKRNTWSRCGKRKNTSMIGSMRYTEMPEWNPSHSSEWQQHWRWQVSIYATKNM